MDLPKKAVALKYNKEKDDAPKVTAKGRLTQLRPHAFLANSSAFLQEVTETLSSILKVA